MITKQVIYKKGDLLLIRIGFLKEVEIQEVSQIAKAIKFNGQWFSINEIDICNKIGYVKYKKRLFGIKRIVVRT